MWSQIVVFYFVGLSFRHHLSCILGRLFFFKKYWNQIGVTRQTWSNLASEE